MIYCLKFDLLWELVYGLSPLKITVGSFAYFLYNIPNFSDKYLFVLGGNMKQMIIVAGAFILCTCSFAGTGFSKGSSQLNALGSAWKSHQPAQIKLNQNDITMGYAGDDVSRRPTLVPQTVTL